MKEQDWKEYERLHTHYETARDDYYAAQMSLRGAFSELARAYNPATLDRNRLYEEEKAHERFDRARRALHDFLNKKFKD